MEMLIKPLSIWISGHYVAPGIQHPGLKKPVDCSNRHLSTRYSAKAESLKHAAARQQNQKSKPD